MSNAPTDPLKERFRPNADPELDRQINDALAGMSVEQIYGFDKPQQQEGEHGRGHGAEGTPGGAVADLARQGIRRGRIVAIRKGDVRVDLGGKSQGVVSE